jgi:hypothetical protein
MLPAQQGSKPTAARDGRAVLCTWCGAATTVAPSAKSVVCPHCNKRLVIEDFRTASYHAVRLLATCGDVFIEKKGHIVAAVRATNLTVEGKLTGNVVAHGRVEIRKTASVKGDIQAALVRIESGASVSGQIHVGATANPTSVENGDTSIMES